MNYVKTGILLVALTLLLVWIGGVFGGQQGAVMAFIFALILNFGSYWFSDKIVLAMYRAKEVTRSEAPELYDLVEGLIADAKLPMPKICVVPMNIPNAFATGRDSKHSAVCVTSGMLETLSTEELRGVLAHELSHIKNRDTLTMTVVATVAGAIMMLANMARWTAMTGGYGRDSRDRQGNILGLLIVTILAPLAAMIIQLAISRTREYAADRKGAFFARSPLGLASALEKLDNAARHYRMPASPNTAHLFIVNPLRGDFLATLFATHPPIAERIKRLKALKIS